MKKISIIIVNYNSGNMIFECVSSIFEYFENENFEIIIVDNASTDDSIKKLESFKYKENLIIIKNDENLGFSKANNIGVSIASGEILFFLNPDTKIIDKKLISFINKIEDNKIYVPLLLDYNLRAYKNVYVLPLIKEYLKKALKIGQVHYWAQGSAIIMTKNTYNKLEGWSEDYFMYAEDLDLFYKAYKNGIKLELIQCYIIHIGGGTTVNIWSKKERALKVEESYYKFSKKYSLLIDYHILHVLNFFRKILFNFKEAFFDIYIYIRFLLSRKTNNKHMEK